MTNPDSIRKVAILVSLLDTRSADALLELMGAQLAGQVRQAVMELSDVAPEEEEQALADFLRREPTAMTDDGVAIELGDSNDNVALPPQPADHPTEPPGAPQSPLHFLSEVDPPFVAEALAREHPQTIAVVVAHLPAQCAGQVLERLPTSLATDALSRMAWLAEPAEGVLEDLACELMRRLATESQPTGGRAGLTSVQAILASLPDGRRVQLIERLGRQDERLGSRLKKSLVGSEDDANDGRNFSLRYRPESPSTGEPAAVPARQTTSPPLLEFEDLTLLSDRDLGRLAAAATTQLLSLALIEADERLTRRLLRALPARQAADVRQRLEDPGPIRLRDIDQAQRELVELARRLAGAGQITLPTSRHFAAAA
jgi:flagellar motor switch protein FliG